MVSIALYSIFGKPFVLYVGAITLISFIITAIIGLSFYRGLLKFKWHPTMVVVSFFLAIIMAVVGISAGNPLVGIWGALTLFSFFIAAIFGLSIHQRWLNIRFRWHPMIVVVSFILATIHSILAISIFG